MVPLEGEQKDDVEQRHNDRRRMLLLEYYTRNGFRHNDGDIIHDSLSNLNTALAPSLALPSPILSNVSWYHTTTTTTTTTTGCSHHDELIHIIEAVLAIVTDDNCLMDNGQSNGNNNRSRSRRSSGYNNDEEDEDEVNPPSPDAELDERDILWKGGEEEEEEEAQHRLFVYSSVEIKETMKKENTKENDGYSAVSPLDLHDSFQKLFCFKCFMSRVWFEKNRYGKLTKESSLLESYPRAKYSRTDKHNQVLVIDLLHHSCMCFSVFVCASTSKSFEESLAFQYSM